jgi:hypothetical protein
VNTAPEYPYTVGWNPRRDCYEVVDQTGRVPVAIDGPYQNEAEALQSALQHSTWWTQEHGAWRPLDRVRRAAAGTGEAEGELREAVLWALRDKKTVTDVADAAGVTRQTVYRWDSEAKRAAAVAEAAQYREAFPEIAAEVDAHAAAEEDAARWALLSQPGPFADGGALDAVNAKMRDAHLAKRFGEHDQTPPAGS